MKKLLLILLLIPSFAFAATTRNVASNCSGYSNCSTTVSAAEASSTDDDSIYIHGPITLNQDWVTIVHNNQKFICVDSRGRFPGDPNYILSDRPIFDAQGTIDPNHQGIWRTTTTIDRLEVNGGEFRNAFYSVDGNATSIRVQQGVTGRVWIHNIYAHDNQMNILAVPQVLRVENCVLRASTQNPGGTNNQHNIYCNTTACDSFYFIGNWSDKPSTGHCIKSRAKINIIMYNRLTDGTSDSTNAQIDLPDAGNSFVIGNILEQGTGTNINYTLLGYGLESESNAGRDLWVFNNTFVNLNTNHATFIKSNAGDGTQNITYKNNVIYGKAPVGSPDATTSGAGTYTQSNNYTEVGLNNNIKFVNTSTRDYHLTSATPSTVLDSAIANGTHDSFDCTASLQYVYGTDTSLSGGTTTRTTSGSGIDIGAFEYQQSGGGGGGGGNDPCTPF